MKKPLLLGLTAAALTLTACQSDAYHISGSGNGLADGDTLYFTTDMDTGTPQDTIIVRDGKFTLDGRTDSTTLCLVYKAHHNEINVPFFLEPGSIKLDISETPGNWRVSGTTVNNEWQRMNDSLMVVGKQINLIAEQIYGGTLSQEEQQKAMAEMDRLNAHVKDIVLNVAQRNITNELGYFIVTYYPEDIISDNEFLELIKQMPDQMRQRPVIREMEEQIQRTADTSEGTTLKDFELNDPNGHPVSIMSLVAQNKLTVIDFWASWCGPCLQEMPFMVSLYDTYKPKGLGIVGISLDSDREAWLSATRRLGITWPQMSDLQGWDNAAARLFDITSIPHTIVVNQQGLILRRGLRGNDLELFIANQLK